MTFQNKLLAPYSLFLYQNKDLTRCTVESRFSNCRFFEPSNYWKQFFFTPLAKMLAEIYTRYLEPISVPLGGSNNRDSTVDLQVSNLQTPPPRPTPL